MKRIKFYCTCIGAIKSEWGLIMKKSLFEKTWFIILMAFIVPPFAIYLIWSKKKNSNKVVKTILTIVLGYFSLIWLVCVLAMFVGETDTDIDVSEYDISTTITTTLISIEENTTERNYRRNYRRVCYG